ncbi:glycosyltransferase [Thiomonas sp. FB-6]|uniref:glycosyltransferase n=1 Tax=Thiomonas sp. FB-6 TaxID=1158291 RepID=UPI0003797077|nr:glycosyltransferase [Thiomonas sp. FB-6]
MTFDSIALARHRHPYYVFAPAYSRTSAGIRVMHTLCHALNRIGEQAFLVLPPLPQPETGVHPDLVTPLLTRWRLEQDFRAGRTPVFVYPETLRGNPFQAPFVARYVLNTPGALGGDASFPASEYCMSYTAGLGRMVPGIRQTLYLPASDPNLFQPPAREQRSGTCLYAGKYQHIHGGKLFDISKDSVEIISNLGGIRNPEKPMQTQAELVELFQRSELLYCYEPSSLALEAMLCGCPVVFLPNPHFQQSFHSDELGDDGWAWGAEPELIERARRSVHRVRERYLDNFARFEEQLRAFVDATQAAVRELPYRSACNVAHLPQLASAQPPQVPGAPAQAAPPRPPLLPWLPQHRLSPQEFAWAQETCKAWEPADTPGVALAMIASRADMSGQTTQQAVAGQWPTGRPLRLLRIDGAGGAAASIQAADRALLDSGDSWLGLIDAEDMIAPDALFRIQHALRLHPQWQLLYTDEDGLGADGQHLNPHCKPDFNLDYLRSLPYIGGLMLVRRDLFEALGGFDPECEGAEDYDLVLRAWERLHAAGLAEEAIGHIPEVLYHRRTGSGHTRKSVPEILAMGQQVLQAHFDRLGIAAQVQGGPFPPSYRVRWPLPEPRPLVSILIPTRDQLPMLQRCIESVIEKTRYPAYEILIIDNDSGADDAMRYLATVESREAELGGRLRVIRAPGEFNFSAMNNLAARAARGEYLLLLNNDTAALHEDWLEEMMAHAVRPDVGAVGAKLLFPDGKIQHAGVILGVRGPAEHPFLGRAPEDRGYFGRAQLVQDLSAVTGACLLVRKSLYEQLGGLDEKAFKVSYNDIDLCLRVRGAGLKVVFTPYALLMHEGSASQKGQVEQKPDEAKQKRFAAERDAMYDKWLPLLARDPAYNTHLSLASTEFQLDDQAPLAWDPAWRPRPRILVHPADREGCGEYRIISPMRALNRAGLAQGWETMRLFQPAEMQRIDADSLVVQRQMEWPQIEALERNARLLRAFRVFEIDDLITNLPVKSVHRAHIHKDIAKRFRKAAGLCNRLVVATEPLAKAYAGFSDEVVVCPNYVERARWGELRPARAERKRLRVGWAGGVGHSGDLELIVDVVRESAPLVDWVFFGLCPPELKDVVREFHPGIPLDQYAPKLAELDLDLAVAPLEHNAFNEAKSHLRLLEYGVLGYPVICSDITPYQGDFPVVRVPNRFRDWMRAIHDAVGDPRALRAQGDALRAKVLADWMLEDHLDTWLRAWTR